MLSMTFQNTKNILGLFALTLFIFSSFLFVNHNAQAQVELVENGGFETGDFTGWTVIDEPGGDIEDTWYVYSGTTAPVSLSTVLAPPEGNFAAIADQDAEGSHLLIQDIDIPANAAAVNCSVIVYYANQAVDFFNPPSLSYLVNPNQQARIDIMNPDAPDFDLGAGVLENIFQTLPGDPLNLGYTTLNFDLSDYAGTTVRFRAAEVDNQFFFNFMIDDLTCVVPTFTEIPTLSEWGFILMASVLGIVGFLVIRRRQVTV